MDKDTIIEMLRKRQGTGTQADLAKAIGVSSAYLSDVFQGHRRPADKILEFLGIERRVVYRKVEKRP